MRLIVTSVLVLTASLAGAPAQENRVRVLERQGVFEAAVPPPGVQHTFEFVSKEMAFDTRVVRGAPYSAEATTEMTQTLADGNRIHRTTKATLYRDSEGRTRREQTLGEVGPLVASGEPVQSIFISDPVAGASYMLNPREHVAHKMPVAAAGVAELKARLAVEHGGGGGAVFYRRSESREQVKNESLGTQTIEGVLAEGTRTTLTIPAGQIGNERPIDIVTERWYSPQLQTVVLTKTSDPRAGETVYKLANIKLEEPSQALFTVPPDYAVK